MQKTTDSTTFANLLGQDLPDAEAQRDFSLEVAKLVAFAELLQTIDEIREADKISKAELARRVGVKPPVISRLLNGEGKNVQLGTLTDVAEALDVYFDIRIKRQPKDTNKRHAPLEVELAG